MKSVTPPMRWRKEFGDTLPNLAEGEVTLYASCVTHLYDTATSIIGVS